MFGTIVGNPFLKLPSIRLTIVALLMSVIHTHQRQRSEVVDFFGVCQIFLLPKWQRSQAIQLTFLFDPNFSHPKIGHFLSIQNHPIRFASSRASRLLSTTRQVLGEKKQGQLLARFGAMKKKLVNRSIFRG